MDCCNSEKKDEKKDGTDVEQVNQKEHPDTSQEESPIDQKEHSAHSHGGCCGGGSMWQHLLLMAIIFAIIWSSHDNTRHCNQDHSNVKQER